MLSIFQILFSGRLQRGGNAVRFFFPIFLALGGLKSCFGVLWRALGGALEGSGEGPGGLWRAPGGALEGLGELGEGLREPLGGIWRDLGVP